MTDYGEQKIKGDDPYRVVMLFKRKKDDQELRKSTVCIFQDCARTSHIIERIPLYMKIAEEMGARAYVTVNPRNVRRARQLLQHRLIDTEDSNQDETNPIAQCIGSLMQAPRKEGKQFIIDIDTKDNNVVGMVMFNAPAGDLVETKNGYHYICPAFDVRKLEGIPDIEVKKDGMTVLSWVKKFSVESTAQSEQKE